MLSRVILDIETVGVDFSSLDDEAQSYLLKGARTDEERAELPSTLSFSPLTGRIVAVALLNPDTNRGTVFYQVPDKETQEKEEENITYVSLPNEEEVLNRTWNALGRFDQIVTFNGRAFDGPYLMVRSAVHKIRPTKNLVPYRYGDDHIDLYDRLGFFGAVRRTMSLHMWCQALGIPSSKTGGITGHEVPAFFKDGRYDEIAHYCMDDVRATAELFRIWNEYLNIK
ncbi:MAG: hypothetical protein UT84_C0028G0007 [Candidatus Curtissbacteria bacterium GW2011_GWA1_40_16]|uniref:Predicted 3'-5' exonuclease PolB-like domain-containing protein n=1 Tax=Candidatus Curtissbacteria bacterium GW2011_GWA1_40_16 TaxID=1618405 RepID=A0A0G0RAJ1_9BACT|nr:MAG: hypothetical protein UT84_C0028G0007 [Candidatus Curtissbacteria bacterium GW2011_GWA1_40_16]